MKKKYYPRVITLDDFKKSRIFKAIVPIKTKWLSTSHGTTIHMASLNSSMSSPPYLKYLWWKLKNKLTP